MSTQYDYIIIGGGIVGLSTAFEITQKKPNASILLLEKESSLAAHQTGHNSGVIHSGIYYKPGSFKAKFARDGNQSMIEFCENHDIAYELCGKVIVATKVEELLHLDNLYQRGLQNGLSIKRLNPEQLNEIEPHVSGLEAIQVPSAGIVNYRQVCETFAKLVTSSGGEILLDTQVTNLSYQNQFVIVKTKQQEFIGKHVINCAGLYSDRVANMAEPTADLKIIPFRGEYFELKPEKRHLVKHLIYPVPNPSFPFLGVHYTRMIGGHVEAGPNAVLALSREGYQKSDINLKDLIEVLQYKGFWQLSAKYWKEGLEEMVRSFSKAAFVKSLQQLIPEITGDDLTPAPAGIRAQALKPNGELVDDFHIIQKARCTHVCNAPSPAATASIEIGKHIVESLPS